MNPTKNREIQLPYEHDHQGPLEKKSAVNRNDIIFGINLRKVAMLRLLSDSVGDFI
jgi:hypothetical protein